MTANFMLHTDKGLCPTISLVRTVNFRFEVNDDFGQSTSNRARKVDITYYKLKWVYWP